MKVSVEDKRIREKNIPRNDRKIVSTANSMGIRIQVASMASAWKGWTTSFSSSAGKWEADGLELMKTGQPLAQLVVDGPIKHIKSGHINGVDHRCDIEYNADGSLKTLIGRGEWFGSYEVETAYGALPVYRTSRSAHTLAGLFKRIHVPIFTSHC